MEARKLTRRRIFHASPQEVFQAFVSAEALKEWWSPEGYIVIEAHADVRVGGQYSLVMRTETGCETVYVRGSYEEIAPPHKLVFTHVFEHRGSDAPFVRVGLAAHLTRVTVEFKAHGSATELVLVQEHIPTPDAEALVRGGWEGIFDRLASYLGRAGRGDPRNA